MTTTTPVKANGTGESSNEVVLSLCDRMKHGEHVTRILENQIETAQQNISLLQGQVRLANETILSLKKHFKETEKLLSQLLPPGCKMTTEEDKQSNEAHSPGGSSVASNDKHDGKSPYAQQLRQVLDVLQDEDTRKGFVPRHKSECGCSECSRPTEQKRPIYEPTPDHDPEQYHHHRKRDTPSNEDIQSAKMYPPPIDRVSPHHNMGYPCAGACCATDKYKPRSPLPPPPPKVDKHHGSYPEPHYYRQYPPPPPPGYLMDGGLPDHHRRKRMSITEEEPPHLKYTKVKRIDGTKLTAQKTLQDFSRRRLLPYNPRYDLDLLIVPPPVPATELLNLTSSVIERRKTSPTTSPMPEDGGINNNNNTMPNREATPHTFAVKEESNDDGMLKSKLHSSAERIHSQGGFPRVKKEFNNNNLIVVGK